MTEFELSLRPWCLSMPALHLYIIFTFIFSILSPYYYIPSVRILLAFTCTSHICVCARITALRGIRRRMPTLWGQAMSSCLRDACYCNSYSPRSLYMCVPCPRYIIRVSSYYYIPSVLSLCHSHTSHHSSLSLSLSLCLSQSLCHLARTSNFSQLLVNLRSTQNTFYTSFAPASHAQAQKIILNVFH
jgi:hypothetical protein